jgi:hypothetical protein
MKLKIPLIKVHGESILFKAVIWAEVALIIGIVISIIIYNWRLL